MALTQGRQLGKLLVQHRWKVVGAFGVGVVAVVGGGLLLSDVQRIPQATPSGSAASRAPEKSDAGRQTGSRTENQSLPQEAKGGVPDAPAPDQNSPSRPVRKRHPGTSSMAKIPDENRQDLATAPPLPLGDGKIAQTTPGPAEAQLAAAPPSSTAALLRLAAETPITIRLAQQVSSKENHKGELFKGTLALPLTANGVVIAHSGAPVAGRIVDARHARLFRGGSYLNLELTQVEGVDGRPLKIKTMQWYETGSHSKVVKAAILPNEAAKKAVVGMISGTKPDEDSGSSHAEHTVEAESPSANEKPEKKKNTVALPPGTEIVFRLVEPLTISDSLERRTDAK